MRFVAPSRELVDRTVFAQSMFDAVRDHVDLLESEAWPAIETLDARLGAPRHAHGGATLHFVAQDRALLDDGLHYEARIHAHGRIATREHNWHDLFNALAWIAQRPLKMALNWRQVGDIARIGPAVRTRAQYALTHFDEAGAIVIVRDEALLARWDAHDWRALFVDARDAWHDGTISVQIFGHALLEHALAPRALTVAKCVVVPLRESVAERTIADATSDATAAVAEAIAAGTILTDPLELRPLPLAGIPGWHPDNTRDAFYDTAECLRPKRAGREYPEPLRVR